MTRSVSAVSAYLLLAAAAPATRVVTSHGATIWPAGSLSAVRFCSRQRPDHIDGYWKPGWRDIRDAERSIPNALRGWRLHHDPASLVTAEAFGGADWQYRWSRNYFGVTRAGRRLLYVDLAPRSQRDGFGMCDGFPSFFGIEYDPASRSIVALASNGIA